MFLHNHSMFLNILTLMCDYDIAMMELPLLPPMELLMQGHI